MLWILRVSNLFSCYGTYFVVGGFSRTIRTANASFVVYKVCLFALSL
jgi:hypothetical protein